MPQLRFFLGIVLVMLMAFTTGVPADAMMEGRRDLPPDTMAEGGTLHPHAQPLVPGREVRSNAAVSMPQPVSALRVLNDIEAAEAGIAPPVAVPATQYGQRLRECKINCLYCESCCLEVFTERMALLGGIGSFFSGAVSTILLAVDENLARVGLIATAAISFVSGFFAIYAHYAVNRRTVLAREGYRI